MKTIFATFGLMLSLMLLVGCGEPSKKTCREEIKSLVEGGVPSAWLKPRFEPIVKTGVDRVDIISIGKEQTENGNKFVPVEARIYGQYTYRRIGQSWGNQGSFDQKCKFVAYQDDVGNWKVKYQDPDSVLNRNQDDRIILMNGRIQFGNFNGEEYKDTSAWKELYSTIEAFMDLVNKTFIYAKEFRERKEFESPQEYQKAADLFWENQRAIYRTKLKYFGVPILKPDKTITQPNYKILRIFTAFDMGKYDFGSKSFPLSVNLEHALGVVGVGWPIKEDTKATLVLHPVPIVGYVSSLSLKEGDVKLAEQLKQDYEKRSLKMFLDCALYAIDLEVLGVSHKKLDVYPLVLQILSVRLYNTRTDPQYQNPILIASKSSNVLYIPSDDRRVDLTVKFKDDPLYSIRRQREVKFPVLENGGWNYRSLRVY